LVSFPFLRLIGKEMPTPKGAERFVQEFDAGESVFHEGDPGREMFVVLSGGVEIYRQTEGDRTHTLAALGQGEMFGEMALVSEGRRFASARALASGTRLVRVDQARFVYLVSQQPAFALSVIRMMAERLAKAGHTNTALAEGV
jgi:CRP/FNR family cyclic AMP-dependent transcriptional regulator